jgi:hypothetical protein
MGMGDELMAAGQAARVSREAAGRKVCIVGHDTAVRWHELWEGLDFITPVRDPDAIKVANGPGCRPYIRYPFTIEGGHGFTSWRARDNRPVISPKLTGVRDNQGFVLIEPTVKRLGNPNKHWHRWQKVVDAQPGARFVQCGPDPAVALQRVEFVRTETFLAAVRLLNCAALYAGSEGGMHHAAAALNVPAVVFFGGALSVLATGYPDHANFGGDDPCGHWLPCAHCDEVRSSITTEAVVSAIQAKL